MSRRCTPRRRRRGSVPGRRNTRRTRCTPERRGRTRMCTPGSTAILI